MDTNYIMPPQSNSKQDLGVIKSASSGASCQIQPPICGKQQQVASIVQGASNSINCQESSNQIQPRPSIPAPPGVEQPKVKIDSTLSKQGYAADAKVSGDYAKITMESAQEAEEAAEEAQESAEEAQTSASSALVAAQAAQESAQEAEESASHMPIIGENYNWWIWDKTTKQYVDTGIPAKGTSDHSQLINRNIADQHTIASITNLQTTLDSKASISAIPTKTSQLTNDSDYITSSYHDATKQDKLPTVVNDRYLHTNATTGNLEWTVVEQGGVTSVNGMTGDVVLDIPSKTSDLTNDSGFITASYHDATKADQAALNEVTAKIPTAATSTNQLADKDFVNSTVATETANFRGTSAQGLTEEQFLAWAATLTKTNNDYIFWDTTDSAGNRIFKRYKYSGAQVAWLYEYTLNNSSFTQAQWNAINSGVSAGSWVDVSTAQQIAGQKDFVTTPRVKSSEEIRIPESLRSTYKELQYITGGSNYNAYIDLGYTPTSTMKTLCQATLNVTQTGDQIIFGSSIASGFAGGNSYAADVMPAVVYMPNCCDWNESILTVTFVVTSGVKHSYKINYPNQDNIGVDSTIITTTSTKRVNNKNIYLFGFNGNGSYSTQYSAKDINVYSFKQWDNDTLICDLVPCQRVSDDVVGMYDLVSETFLTSAGSGNFVAGEEFKEYINLLTDEGLATVAKTGSYSDLNNKPTIPTVNNATLTIQKNGTTVNTFTANSSTNKTANIEVPTKTSEITNDSGFITSDYHDSTKQDLITSTNKLDYSLLSNTPAINDASLVIKKNGTQIASFSANSATDTTANIEVPTKTSELTNDSGFLTQHQDISGKEDKSNKVITMSASSTDTEYPSAKCVYSADQTIREQIAGLKNTYVISDITNPIFNSQSTIISTSSPITDISAVVHQLTDFSIGDTIYITETDVPDRWCSKRTIVQPTGQVPEGYTEIGSLEATGTQKILTNITIASTSDYYFEVSIVPTNITGTAATSGYNGIVGNNSNPQLGWYTGGWTVGNGSSAIPYAPKAGQQYTITWNKQGLGDVIVDGIDTNLRRAGTLSTNLFVIESNTTNAKARLYYAKIRQRSDDTVINWFVPCKRDSDSELGVYDIVGRNFYIQTGSLVEGAAQSTLEFSKLETAKPSVTDVQLNSTSVVTNTIANIPYNLSSYNNDSGFITSSYHDSTKQDLITSTNKLDYSLLDNTPAINDATLTIQKNGTQVAQFTANSATNITADIDVPTKTSDLTNDSGFITSSAISGKEDTSNKITSISSSSTDTQYPSGKAVYDLVSDLLSNNIAHIL